MQAVSPFPCLADWSSGVSPRCYTLHSAPPALSTPGPAQAQQDVGAAVVLRQASATSASFPAIAPEAWGQPAPSAAEGQHGRKRMGDGLVGEWRCGIQEDTSRT